ncbi:hypothetical protein D3W54_13030 [Komagataeibacter medellinensis]|uniref:Secreted protein n=1 Tax=Komagataeibacter medellinensis TaxID=1177712 RepID=A0ABQ6VYX0_9PROT|nr:hypothetical protein D3W54_13030 [Komagataeibacter medellinensis]
MMLLGAGLAGSMATPAHARTHPVTDMEADRLTLSALTAVPPPPVRHASYQRRTVGHGRAVPVVLASSHGSAAHTRHTMVHTIVYHPHGTAVHHIHPVSSRHRT